MGETVKRGHPRESANNTGDEPDTLDLEEQEKRILQTAYLLPWRSGLWVSREYLLELGPGYSNKYGDGT